MAERHFLLAAGLLTGAVAAALAILPGVTRPEAHVPYGLITAFLFGTGYSQWPGPGSRRDWPSELPLSLRIVKSRRGNLLSFATCRSITPEGSAKPIRSIEST